jgi:hypothetical protein
MLTVVQVAVVAAAVAFVAVAGAAVYAMVKALRLLSEAAAAVTGLRERGDLLIDRASAAVDQAGEQIARTQTVTASMESVTATMADLGGHLTALAPPPAATESASSPLTWAAALAYGVRWALGLRWAADQGAQRQPGPARPAGTRPAGSRPARTQTARTRPWLGRAAQLRPEPPGQGDRDAGRRAAPANRANGTAR